MILLAFSSRDVCVFGFFSALLGARAGTMAVVARSSGKWLFSANCVATFRKDVF